MHCEYTITCILMVCILCTKLSRILDRVDPFLRESSRIYKSTSFFLFFESTRRVRFPVSSHLSSSPLLSFFPFSLFLSSPFFSSLLIVMV